MRKILSLCLLVLSVLSVSGQMKLKGLSKEVSMIRTGDDKVLLLSNGNTAYLKVGRLKEEGIYIWLFDANHRLKVSKHLLPKYVGLRYILERVEAIFESEGNIVMLVTKLAEKEIPVLYRIVIDGEKGTFKEQVEMLSLPYLGFAKRLGFSFGNVPVGFNVKYDPASGSYAVLAMHSSESDRGKRLEVILYDKKHEIINRGFFPSPEEKYKFLEYNAMEIVGETVHMIAYAYNTRASGGEEQTLVFGSLKKGANVFEVTDLHHPVADLHNARGLNMLDGMLRYNRATGKLIYLSYTPVPGDKKWKKWETNMILIDPAAPGNASHKVIFPEEASKKSIELFGKKVPFTGGAVDMSIHPDGGFTVFFEEVEGLSDSYSPGQVRHIVASEFGNKAVLNFNRDGEVINTYFIPFQQSFVGDVLPKFYHSMLEQKLLNRPGGCFFIYLKTEEGPLMLLSEESDAEEWLKKGEKKPLKTKNEKKAGKYYLLQGDKIIPSSKPLLAEEDTKKEKFSGPFHTQFSDYDPEKKILAIAINSGVDDKRFFQLIWLQL